MRKLLFKSLLVCFAAAFLFGALSACSQQGEFTLDETAEVAVGLTKKLTLINTTANKTVVWESKNEAIATVSRTGTVTGVEPGKTTITATAGDFKATCELTVTGDANIIPVSGAISNADQLRSIGSKANMLTRNYYLTNDIDFAGGTLETIGNWTIKDAIGNIIRNEAAYSGVFDGKGFAIMNVTFNGGSENKNTDPANATFGTALFTVLTGTVKNLNLINVKVEGSGFTSSIAGKNAGKIENCYVGGAQTLISANMAWEWWVPAGGLVAMNEASGSITNCLYNGTELTFGFALVGWNFGAVTNCYAASDRYPAEDRGDDRLILTDTIKPSVDSPEIPCGPFTGAFLTDAQLKIKDNYTGFSSDVWELADGKMAYLKGAGVRSWASI